MTNEKMQGDAALGLWLKNRREALKITGHDVSRFVGWRSTSTLFQIEAGIRLPPPGRIKRYARVLQMHSVILRKKIAEVEIKEILVKYELQKVNSERDFKIVLKKIRK